MWNRDPKKKHDLTIFWEEPTQSRSMAPPLWQLCHLNRITRYFSGRLNRCAKLIMDWLQRWDKVKLSETSSLVKFARWQWRSCKQKGQDEPGWRLRSDQMMSGLSPIDSQRVAKWSRRSHKTISLAWDLWEEANHLSSNSTAFLLNFLSRSNTFQLHFSGVWKMLRQTIENSITPLNPLLCCDAPAKITSKSEKSSQSNWNPRSIVFSALRLPSSVTHQLTGYVSNVKLPSQKAPKPKAIARQRWLIIWICPTDMNSHLSVAQILQGRWLMSMLIFWRRPDRISLYSKGQDKTTKHSWLLPQYPDSSRSFGRTWTLWWSNSYIVATDRSSGIPSSRLFPSTLTLIPDNSRILERCSGELTRSNRGDAKPYHDWKTWTSSLKQCLMEVQATDIIPSRRHSE
jgi:hypothetical protein